MSKKSRAARLREAFERQLDLFSDRLLPEPWRLVPHDAGLRLPDNALLGAHPDGRLAVVFGRCSLRLLRQRFGHLVVPLGGELVHRIICATFHGAPPFAGAQVRHLDGNPANNKADNLAWGTQAENMADMVLHGKRFDPTAAERKRIAEDLYFSMLPGPVQVWNWGLPGSHKRRVLMTMARRRKGYPSPNPFGKLKALERPTLPGFEPWPPSDPGPPDWPPER